jgi:Dyp-type peroxidase family
MKVDVAEVQGNILHAYGTACTHAAYQFLRVEPGKAAAATRVIAGLAGEVTFGDDRDMGQLGVHLNLAFTYSGLEALGVPADVLATFPEDFRAGARERSFTFVGDRGPNAPDCWEDAFTDPHVLLVVHSDSAGQCTDFVAAWVARAAGALTPVGEVQEAGLLGHRETSRHETCGVEFTREHFGFADGCSQPVIDGVPTRRSGESNDVDGVYARIPRHGTIANILEDVGILKTKRAWRRIPPGEFILGYVDEDGQVADGVASELGTNGTFMVYRKLRQYVGVFNAHVEKAAGGFQVGVDDLKAKIIGRTVDGRPLLKPNDDGADTDAVAANAFTYANDRYGAKCPVGAHIRRANPRDALPGGSEVATRHRMIRRGMPYGPRWADAPDDGQDRGLIFIAYMASIDQGFEFVQRAWCYDGHAFGLGGAGDYILQQPDDDGRMRGMWIPGMGLLDPPPEPLVTVSGCEYLFVPSKSACGWIAGLHA